MNHPDDQYGALIRSRRASEAADLLADECRKRERTIAQLREGIARLIGRSAQPGADEGTVARRKARNEVTGRAEPLAEICLSALVALLAAGAWWLVFLLAERWVEP